MSDVLASVRERILEEERAKLPLVPKELQTTWEAAGGWAGFVSGAWAGAAIGAHIGIAMGPLGAIAGTVPGAILGGIIGAFTGAKVGSVVEKPQVVRPSTSSKTHGVGMKGKSPILDNDLRQRLAVEASSKYCPECGASWQHWFDSMYNCCGKCGFQNPYSTPINEPQDSKPSKSAQVVYEGVKLQNSIGQYLTVDAGDSHRVTANCSVANNFAIFTLYDLDGSNLRDGDHIHLKSSYGTFLRAVGGGGGRVVKYALQWSPCEDCTFQIIKVTTGSKLIYSGDMIALMSRTGHYICCDYTVTGNEILANRTTRDQWETFKITF